MSVVATKRLVLRPFELTDAPRVAELISGEAVHRWITRAPRPFGVSDAEWFIDAHSAPDAPVFATTFEGAVIGCCSITDEFGYWIAKPYWGKGFATEAGFGLLAQYFDHAEEPLVSGYIQGNAASANVLGKLGFSNAGFRTRRSEFFKHDVTIQSMTLSKAEWWAGA